MSLNDFWCVAIGGNNKLILCRRIDSYKAETQKVIKEIFPELPQGILVKVRGCNEIPLSEIVHSTIDIMRKENDWDKYPFVALRISEKNGETYCDSETICA
ncbi:MAG: hypothetical protein KKC96_00135 [Nanoarchaeota archaeon]|nr:hypothetical protein [Nanoarchaeota archaeon]